LAAQAAGGRNEALNRAAYALGALEHYGAVDEREAHVALKTACERNHLIADDGLHAFEVTFSSGWTAGLANKKEIPELEQARSQDGARQDERAADDDQLRQFSDDALALQFTDRLGNGARYVAAWSRWLFFDGVRWREDATLRAFSEARTICREAASGSRSTKVAAKVKSAVTVAAVERLARADRRHAATADQWDVDPWLLNTPSGTVDLHTGKLRPAHRDDYMTKSTAVAPAGGCPLWRAFLERIFRDLELIKFVQRSLGYALTGSTSAHALFFSYGTGANGKGTLINTVTAILGDYASVAPMETFTARFGERHPTDLAMLRGARLVASQETEQGRAWAEARIKALTGGDPISARFMRADFFTFNPQFKLWIAGNHKPSLRGVDEAMRRRFNLIPFTETIPAAERDAELPAKLKAEWPGILAWMVEGCLEWQRVGLAPPSAVTAATAEYFAEEDVFGGWLEEFIRPAYESATETTADLFASWKRYAEAAGESAGSKKELTANLKERGFVPHRIGHTRARGFAGIRLQRPATAAHNAA
jgi:putative DNA primase/helicase